MKKIMFLLLLGGLVSFSACEKDGEGLEEGDPVKVTDLPQGVFDYATANYPGYTVASAASDPLCQGGDAYDVKLTKSGSPDVTLIFTTDGTFVQKEEELNFADLPQAAKDYITANFAGWTPASLAEKFILADGSIQYQSDLTKGSSSKELILKEDGTLFCEK